MAAVEFLVTHSCVCLHTWTRESDEEKDKYIYRQNGWSHKGPAESPETVWLETDHHFNVLAKPLQACIERKEVGMTEKGDEEVCTSKFNPFLCAW